MTEASGPTLSFIIPCLNEEENIAQIVDAVRAEATKLALSYEVVVIDNASTDRTVEIAKQKCAEDPAVRLIVNNKNYGQMRSPTHGVYATRGEVVIGLCADFQDPPALIPEFVSRWRAGSKIVLGVRVTERMSPLMRLSRWLGYAFFERFADYRVIPGATGFGLYDREVIEALKQWREPEPFWRGMLVESGFSLSTVPYHRPERAAGRSKNTFLSNLSFAISGLAGSSKQLLRTPFYLAFITGLLATLSLIISAMLAASGHSVEAWLLAALIETNFAILFLVAGVIGEQVRLVSERTRNVPLVIEKERVNF